MDENRNNPVQWLRYLLYAGLANVALSILNAFTPLGGLLGWLSIAIGLATVYLLFQLSGINPRYRNAAIFGAVGLAIAQLPIAFVALAGSICSLIGEYQEYHAHGELIEERDPKLADQWGTLFGLQFAASIVVVLLAGLAAGVLAAATKISEAAITVIVTAIVAVIGVALRVLYLRYLKRTIALLENEVVA